MNDHSIDTACATSVNPVRAITEHGQFYILRDFPGQAETLRAVTRCFHDALEDLFGRDCADEVKKAGLRKLHEFVPAERLAELKRRVNDQMKSRIHQLVYSVGRNVLKLEQEFWASELVITRIHYPFHREPVLAGLRPQGRSGGTTTAPIPATSADSLSKRIWLWLGNLRAATRKGISLFDLTVVLWNIPIVLRQAFDALRFRATAGARRFKPVPGLETSAVHGPHLDIWNGLPYDGVTLWWAIDDVSETAGLLLYPELFGMAAPRSIETKSGQFALGCILPPPQRIGLKAGDLLLFSEDKMYHASHLNVTDDTRIVISTHMCLTRPRFSTTTRFAFEQFFSSSHLAVGALEPTRFSFRDHASPGDRLVRANRLDKPTLIRLRGRLPRNEAVAVCKSDALSDGERCLVRLDDRELIVLRDVGALFCVSALCPHQGYNLVFGGYAGGALHCPGHGVSFDLRNGRSACPKLRLDVFTAFDEGGLIHIRR